MIAALRAFLEARSSPSRSRAPRSPPTSPTLLEHRALVLGRGSFGVAVAALSTNIQTLYFPWSEPRLRGLSRERDLNAFLIDEISPQYIPEEVGATTHASKGA